MKVNSLLIISFFFFGLIVYGQTARDIFLYETTHFLNEEGSPVSEEEFQNILRENPAKFHRWDQIENDSIRISKLIPKKEELNLSYPDIFQALENITNTSIPGNPVIILFYNYLDDICSPPSGFNQWGTMRIRAEKRFSDNLRRRIQEQYPNVIAFHFFEPGISFEPSQVLKQHFFLDRNLFFRKAIFTTSSSCGSIAIIAPGGNTIIHHGETSIPVLAQLPGR